MEKIRPLDNFDDIIKFSASAIKIYDKLAELEYEGKVGTQDYFDLIGLLQYIREYEDKKWAPIHLDTNFFQNYLTSLCKQKGIASEDILFALDINGSNPEYKRFVSYAQAIAADRNETITIDDPTPEEMARYKKQLKEQYGYDIEVQKPSDCTPTEVKDFIDAEVLEEEKVRNKIERYRDEALSHTYIYYLQELINNTEDEVLKKYLLKAKYRTIGVNPRLEEYFLYRAPNFLLTKLFQRFVEVDIKGKENFYQEVYLEFLKNDMEEAIRELNEIDYMELPLEQGGGYALLESIYIRACNSINPSGELDGDMQILKQNALKKSKSDYAKKLLLDSFKVNKEVTMTKNVDF